MPSYVRQQGARSHRNRREDRRKITCRPRFRSNLPKTSAKKGARKVSTRRPEGLYSVLGVCVGASARELKEAYKKQCLLLHPDKNVNETPQKRAARTVRLREVQEAFNVLREPESRRKYDRSLGLSACEGESKNALKSTLYRRKLDVETLVEDASLQVAKRHAYIFVNPESAAPGKWIECQKEGKTIVGRWTRTIGKVQRYAVLERQRSDMQRDRRLNGLFCVKL